MLMHNSVKDAMKEALSRKKKLSLDKSQMSEDDKRMQDEQDDKSADLAPDVKDSGAKKLGLEIEIKPGGDSNESDDGNYQMSPGHDAMSKLSDNGKPSDLSILMGRDAGPDEIAQLAGGGKPKSLFEAASKALAMKHMKK